MPISKDMRRSLFASCAFVLLACASCSGQAWSTHADPLGFRVDMPAGWQVAGDVKSGRILISGPAGEHLIIWPVFVPGAVDVRAAPALLRRLTAAAGIRAEWTLAAASSPNAVRMAGPMGDQTAVSSFAWVNSPSGTAGFLYIASAPAVAYRAEVPAFSRILASFRA